MSFIGENKVEGKEVEEANVKEGKQGGATVERLPRVCVCACMCSSARACSVRM